MNNLLARLGGRILAGGVAALRLVRGPRPMHPHGVALRGTFTPLAGHRPSGLDWLDALDSPVPVDARLSRGIGLPAPLPDIQGLAFRLPIGEDRATDILVSSSRLGVPGRFLLTLRRSASGARFSTLMPYRGANGPVLLGLIADAEPHLPAAPDAIAATLTDSAWHLRVLHATPGGLWYTVGDLELRHDPDAAAVDTDRHYDPVLTAPASSTYDWTRRLREPGYSVGRAGQPVASRTSGPDAVPQNDPQ